MAKINKGTPPKPFESWVFNEETFGWNSPIAYPSDGYLYLWNEETTSWNKVE
jgi:hypothetical protein